ncbi:MAG TPA: CHAT domain-containing protein [Gemmatimonadaceae bacterium]|nr:CHAT domain-containing protein [Gemmatimonadaceae bacterium]
MDAAKITEALPLARQRAETLARTRKNSKEHIESLLLLVRALDLAGLGGGDEAVRSAQALVALAKSGAGVQSEIHITLAVDVANRHNNRGDPAAASRALAFVSSLPNTIRDSNPAGVAAAIYELGRAENALGDTPTAIRRHREARILLKGVSPLPTEDLSTVENDLAVLLYQSNEFAEADGFATSARALRLSLGPEAELLVAQSSAVGALVSVASGQLERARVLAVEAGDILRRHPESAPDLRILQQFALGTTLAQLGDGKAAVPMLEGVVKMTSGSEQVKARVALVIAYIAETRSADAVSVAEQLLSESTRNVPMLRLAVLEAAVRAYSAAGSITRARQISAEALSIISSIGDSPLPLTVLVNLATPERMGGDHARAVNLLTRALTISDRVHGRSSQVSISIMANIAQVYSAADRGSEAMAAFKDAFNRSSDNTSKSTLLLAPLLFGLGVHLLEEDPSEAFRFFNMLREDIERAGLSNSGAYWLARGFAAGRLLTDGTPAQAVQELDIAIAGFARSDGAYGGLLGAFEGLRGLFQILSGDHRSALASASDSVARLQAYVQGSIRGLPHADALAMTANLETPRDLLLSLALRATPDELLLAYGQLVILRGISIDEMAARRQMTASIGPDRRATLLSLQTAQARLAQATYVPSSTEAEKAKIQNLRDTIRNHEGELGLSAPLWAIQPATQVIPTLQKNLPKLATLVSFFAFDDMAHAFATPQRKLTSEMIWDADAPRRFAAVVVSDGRPTRSVLLGEAAVIDAAIDTWRQCLTSPQASTVSRAMASEGVCVAAAQRVRELVWDPIEPLVADSKRIIIAPDGQLRLISWAALVDRDGRYFVDRPELFSVVDAERDLLRTPRRQGHSRAMMLVADPAFSVAVSPRISALEIAPGSLRSTPGCDAPMMKFELLPGSREEAARIRELSDRQVPAWTTNVRLGSAASEASVREGASKAGILHIATHAFTLTRDCGVIGQAATLQEQAVDPLLLSGIALAGANDRAALGTEDDGILTAAEIATWSLPSVELVVLSACDTGLGRDGASEGLLGLRRAFAIAGASRTVTSLWSVDDAATSNWMRLFYTAIFTAGMDPFEATKDASRKLREERRRAGLSTHPFYWAAFVAAGIQ